MRIGLISDVHGNSPALDAALSALRGEVDKIVFLGDLCGYYPFVEQCVALWDEDLIVGIRGNHDQFLLNCRETGIYPSGEYKARYGSALMRSLQNLSSSSAHLLQSLPLSSVLTINGVVLSLYHGAPWDPLEGRVYPDFDDWDRFKYVAADYILLGHTHYPLIKKLPGKTVINPGSVGQARDRSGAACFSVLDLPSGEVQQHHVLYDPRSLIEDARKHDPDIPYLVEVLTGR